MGEVCLLLSGGIDSMVCLDILKSAGRRVEAIFIDFGQPARAYERASSISIAQHFQVPWTEITCHFPIQFDAGEIPHRNGFLVFAAAMVGRKNAGPIAIGIHAGVPYADCQADFIRSIELTLQKSGTPNKTVIAPLASWLKAEIISYARGLPIELSYSCERGSMPPCGECASCRDYGAL